MGLAGSPGEAYLIAMQALLSKSLAAAIAAILATAILVPAAPDAASAQQKPRPQRPASSGLVYDTYGTPIIMNGMPPMPVLGGVAPAARAGRDVDPKGRRVLTRPIGSSTYIPPPVPSPNSPNSPPSSVLLQMPAQPYKPPPINSFGDRVINCIHAAPLSAGVGNNPSDRTAFVGQCAN